MLILIPLLIFLSNPKDYNDNEDARVFDTRLRAPIQPIELEIDQQTGMKNYIAGKGDWATSFAFVKYSFEKSIHHGRLYCNGQGFFKGKDEDLAEALRCLGQGLHTLEDFGAHTNYVELSLRELGFANVFPHTGANTMMNLHGKQVFPLVTGTFGMVDFYHSVLGEATDHFTQSEVNEMEDALGTAEAAAQSSNPVMTLVHLLSKVPGTRDLCIEAEQLQRASEIQARENAREVNASADQTDQHLASTGHPSSGSYGSMEHTSKVTQPDWSAPQAMYPDHHTGYSQQSQNQGSFNQQQDWNQHQPQQPSWSENPPAYSDGSNFNEQQVAGSHWHLPSSGVGGPTSYSQDPIQQYNQQTSDFNQQHGYGATQQPDYALNPSAGHAQAELPATQQHDYAQSQSENYGQQTTASTIQSTPPKPQQPPPQTSPIGLPGLPNFDPQKTIRQIYPILAFRDKVVRTISAIIEKIPGLEALVERITETVSSS